MHGRIIVSVSMSYSDREYLKQNFISPSKLLKNAIKEHKKNNNLNDYELKLKQDIKIMENYFNESLKPNVDSKIYEKAIELFLKKYPTWTKAEIIARAEKTRKDLLDFDLDAEKLI